MIVKRISRAGGASIGKVTKYTKSQNISHLCIYIVDGKERMHSRQIDKEKVLYSGSENFVFDDFEAQISEILVVAGAARKVAQPVEHFVCSWRPGEIPTEEQVKQTVKFLVDEAGMAKHQYVWGCHKNTDSIHVHIALNRVDPQTLELKRINNGFDFKLCQRVAAKIEAVQKWEPLPNLKYRYDVETGIYHATRAETDKIQRKKDQTDLKARARDLATIFKNANSWQTLHDSLRKQGAYFAPKCGGAIVRFTGVSGAVKASGIHKDASMAALRKKLGDFKADQHRQQYYSESAPAETIRKFPMYNFIQSMTSSKNILSNYKMVSAIKKHFKDYFSSEATIYKKIENDAREYGLKIEDNQLALIATYVYSTLHDEKEQKRQHSQDKELSKTPDSALELLLLLILALFGVRMATLYELKAQQEAERQALLLDAVSQGLPAEVVDRMVEEQAKRHQTERKRSHLSQSQEPTASQTERQPQAQEWADCSPTMQMR